MNQTFKFYQRYQFLKSYYYLILIFLCLPLLSQGQTYSIRTDAFGGYQWGNPVISKRITQKYMQPVQGNQLEGYKIFEGLEYPKAGTGWHAGLTFRFKYNMLYFEVQPQYTTFSVQYQFYTFPLQSNSDKTSYKITTSDFACPLIIGVKLATNFRFYGGYVFGLNLTSENKEAMEANSYKLVKFPQSWLVGVGYDVKSDIVVLNRFSIDLKFTGNFTGNFAPTSALYDLPVKFNKAFKNYYFSVGIGFKIFGKA